MKFRCIDLFCGAGGLALGLEKAGFEHIALVDSNKDCCKTIQINRPNWNIIHADIKTISLCFEDIDLICGGPPCQPFSIIGKKLGFEDIRANTFFSFIGLIQSIKPKIFLMENVKNLLKMNNSHTFFKIIKAFTKLGYNCDYEILNANCFEVPQNRERLFIIGIRNDIYKKEYIFPQGEYKLITLRKALHNVSESEGHQYTPYKKRVMDLVPEGGCWRDLPEDIAMDYIKNANLQNGGNTGIAKRLSWDKASPTLLCSATQKLSEKCHPSETRPLTIREYARIQTFPDDWEFYGSLSSKYRQIGNAVPVNLAEAIGYSIYNYLEWKPNFGVMPI